MKVLLAHCRYRSASPSGEDVAFRNEGRMLEDAGVEVVRFELENDGIDVSTAWKRADVALSAVWSRGRRREISELVRRVRPDVAHFHNTFPGISPSGYAACREQGVPVVQTVHNYRFFCPNGLLLREGRPCEECLGRLPWRAVARRCYRGSALATGAQCLAIARNRIARTWSRAVDRYIALSGFAAGRLAAGGLPPCRISVKPNVLSSDPLPGTGDGGFAIFVGRLSEEKGIGLLLEAWRELRDIPLEVVGDGPLRGEMEAFARRERLPVRFAGMVPHAEAVRRIGRSALLVLPSICYEGFPMTVLEAYARGTPVVATGAGSLDELVEDGLTGAKFPRGDADALAGTIRTAWSDPSKRERMRRGARVRFEERYAARVNLRRLLEIYRLAAGRSGHLRNVEGG